MSAAPGGPKSAVIIQPCFFPWRGQFDLISRGDALVFLDTVQYSHHNWYNRNRIMTPQGARWITVPVYTRNHLATPIRDIKIKNQEKWRKSVLGQIYHAYLRKAGFAKYFPEVEEIINREWEYLSDLSQASVAWCMARLGLDVETFKASELGVDEEDPVRRLVAILEKIGATRYLSGPSARDYIGDGALFREAGIELEWMEYPQYPVYGDGAQENLSILDLFFNAGSSASEYIWPGGRARRPGAVETAP